MGIDSASMTRSAKHKLAKMRLLPLIGATYFMVSGGPVWVGGHYREGRVWAGHPDPASGAFVLESANVADDWGARYSDSG